MNTRIGYASQNLDVIPNTYRTCRKDNITESILRELITHNLEVLNATIDYNIENNNHLFRVSSSLIPFGSSELNTLNWEAEFVETFKLLRNKIDKHDIKISLHPGQYTILNSPNELVVKNAINDLDYHVKLLNLLTDSKDSIMIIHIGGIYGDKDKAMERFIQTYESELKEQIRQHLVIENDDRLFTVEDALYISSKVGVPVVFDNLHHAINPSLEDLTMDEIIEKVLKTWSTRSAKFHYSQQAKNKRAGAHTETIHLNQFIFDYKKIYQNKKVDIMLEVKDKNRSFIKVNQYLNPSQKVLEKEWARYKYYVMSKSQKAYNDLRTLFKNNKSVDAVAFYEIIDNLETLDENLAAEMNAASHVWGYFKKIVSQKEKEIYLNYYNLNEIKKIKKYLYKLSVKYKVNYLLESYYF